MTLSHNVHLGQYLPSCFIKCVQQGGIPQFLHSAVQVFIVWPTQPKIDQVDTVLMAEQYCNMAVIMIKQHC